MRSRPYIKLLASALIIDRADIVGHSPGSIVAHSLAAYWPERTRHLVLIAWMPKACASS
jgi:pimeloyl-ACP methyl ester carboxylesterase